jgi:hypothetical protein
LFIFANHLSLLGARSASALPTRAALPPLHAVGEPPTNPFSAKKENWRGKSQKKAKGVAGGALAGRYTPAGGAAQIAILAEMGSDFGVKSHQEKSLTPVGRRFFFAEFYSEESNPSRGSLLPGSLLRRRNIP